MLVDPLRVLQLPTDVMGRAQIIAHDAEFLLEDDDHVLITPYLQHGSLDYLQLTETPVLVELSLLTEAVHLLRAYLHRWRPEMLARLTHTGLTRPHTQGVTHHVNLHLNNCPAHH